MRAAILDAFGTPLRLADIDDPVAGPGDTVVDVAAVGVLPYTDEVFSGERKYPLTLPVVPGLGAIGRVREVGPDATHLQSDDWVLCDPTIRSRDGGATRDITLQGWSGRGEGGLLLQRHFGQGAFAQRLLLPTENVVPIGDIDPADASRWTALGVCLVPYGGLRAGALQPGETVLISGSTGYYGSAAVQVALAMGAGRVVTPGRNRAMLEELAGRFGSRVAPVELTGQDDTARMRAAAGGDIDLVLDILPPAAGADVSRTALMTVRESGRVVLMGGVGMLGGDELSLPYPWIMRNNITVRGQWMYTPDVIPHLIGLARSGLLDLSGWRVDTFDLEHVSDAVAHAAAHNTGFAISVVEPN